jgi:hypothetical protein
MESGTFRSNTQRAANKIMRDNRQEEMNTSPPKNKPRNVPGINMKKVLNKKGTNG